MFFCKMASKSDFDTFLAQFWVAFGGILEAYGRHSSDFLGTFFQGLFFDGFLCLRPISGRLKESPGRDYREGKPSLRGEG